MPSTSTSSRPSQSTTLPTRLRIEFTFQVATRMQTTLLVRSDPGSPPEARSGSLFWECDLRQAAADRPHRERSRFPGGFPAERRKEGELLHRPRKVSLDYRVAPLIGEV